MTRSSRAVARRAERDYPPDVVQELATLEARLGGRQQLVGMLMLAPLTPDLRYFLGLLGDPQHASKSLAEMCVTAGVFPADLLRHMGEAALLRGKVEAAQAIGAGIGAVARDVMKKAAPYRAPCYTCRGTGTFTPEPTTEQPNPSPGPCDTCQGVGELEYQPDLDRQKLAIEMAHLLPKGGGINIAQINGGKDEGKGGAGLGAFDQMQQLTDRLLHDIGPGSADEAGAEPTDGEILEERSDAEN